MSLPHEFIIFACGQCGSYYSHPKTKEVIGRGKVYFCGNCWKDDPGFQELSRVTAVAQ